MPVEQGQTRIYRSINGFSRNHQSNLPQTRRGRRSGSEVRYSCYITVGVVAWLLGTFGDELPCGAARSAGLLVHISVGLANIASVVLRIAWRSFDGKSLCRLLAVKPVSIEPEISMQQASCEIFIPILIGTTQPNSLLYHANRRGASYARRSSL
jgi:hypothetical protein